ncbi:hypothetical protein D3C72_1717800 [compost metagenome]
MEMRWEKLYSGGLAEFRKSERPICRPGRQEKSLELAWLGALLTMLTVGCVLIFW